uniref:Uncharacterized protein n=1 Tax=Romanomermis culicivorax TaxID=13658 RepID=A0A915K911_ROMCU
MAEELERVIYTCLFRRNRTERNEIDPGTPNEREIFVPFGSVGGYRRSYKIAVILPDRKGVFRLNVSADGDPFCSVEGGKYK